VIAEFAIGKRARTGTVGSFRIFLGKRFAWMGLWTAWISTAIGFYYAVVAGWCLRYFFFGASGELSAASDVGSVWNDFLMSGTQVVLFQFLIIGITLAAIWRGAKAIEKTNIAMMTSLFVLLFLALGLSLWMDGKDGSLDGMLYMFTVRPEYLAKPETWINGLSQSAWSCSAGMGMAITYAVYMRKDEDITLNAFTMGLANNSISIIAGVTVMSAIFAASLDPVSTVSGGSSAITFLALPEVFNAAPGGVIGSRILITVFFLALTFAALTSMISTVELTVRNLVDHGVERNRAVLLTSITIFICGVPSALLGIKMDSDGIAFPEFLEVQDHIWGYGLMFSGLFIAFAIWRYGWAVWRSRVAAGEAEDSVRGWLTHGVPAFRDEFVNTGDNDLWIGKWWDFIMYVCFPFLFLILMGSYFTDLHATAHDPWNPFNPHGIAIILFFWGVIGFGFMLINGLFIIRHPVYKGEGRWWSGLLNWGDWELVETTLTRNVPEGASASIDTLPGGSDSDVVNLGEMIINGDIKDAALVDEDVSRVVNDA